MARPRVYRHDVRCPECGSNWMPKDGTSQGRQVDHCGDGGRRTIPDAAYQRPGGADKERVLALGSVSRRSASGLQGGRKAHCGRSRSPAGGGDCV